MSRIPFLAIAYPASAHHNPSLLSSASSNVPLDLPEPKSRKQQPRKFRGKRKTKDQLTRAVAKLSKEADEAEDVLAKLEQRGIDPNTDLTPACLGGAVDALGIRGVTSIGSCNTRKLCEGKRVLLPTSEHALLNQTGKLSEQQLANIAYQANWHGRNPTHAGFTMGGKAVTNIKGKKVSASASAAQRNIYNDDSGLKEHNADRATDAKGTILYLEETQGTGESIKNIDLRVLSDEECLALDVPPGSSWKIGEQPKGTVDHHHIEQLVQYHVGLEKFQVAKRKGERAQSTLKSNVLSSFCRECTAHGGFTLRRFYQGDEVTGCGPTDPRKKQASYVFTARKQDTRFFAP